jgi:tetratricopeptide (TPR) repeat protein
VTRGAWIAALAIAAAIGTAHADPGFTAASLPPGEAQRSVDEFRAREMDPRMAELAVLFRCLGAVAQARYDDAQRYCSAAIALSPDNPGPYKLRAEASLFQGRYQAALDDADRAIALDKTDAENFAARAEAFRMLRQFRRAISDFNAAIALSPEDARYWNGRCWIRAEANIGLGRALKDCARSHALAPRFAAALDSRGLVHIRLKHYALAIRDYDEAIGIQPRYPSALFGRGLAKLHLRRTAGGQADIRKARAMDPDVDAFFARMGITGRGLAMPYAKRAHHPRSKPLPAPLDQLAKR